MLEVTNPRTREVLTEQLYVIYEMYPTATEFMEKTMDKYTSFVKENIGCFSETPAANFVKQREYLETYDVPRTVLYKGKVVGTHENT